MCAHTETDRCIINYSQGKKTEIDTYRNRQIHKQKQPEKGDRQTETEIRIKIQTQSNA